MTDFVLTMLDTSGIQDYIFGSNRLQENIGASELVYRVTTLWAFKALEEAGMTPHNVQRSDKLNWELSEGGIERSDSKLKAEVVYAGGGNTMLIFRDIEDAKKFTRKLTRRVLQEAPGLTLVAQHLKFIWEDNDLLQKRLALLKELGRHKQNRLPSVPFLGLGVSAVCQSTSLAAVRDNTGTVEIEGKTINLKLSQDEETRLLSSETVAKLGWRNFANERLDFWLRDAAGGYRFPYDIDKLGRLEGEESYVAVIHADGNKMGDHVGYATKDCKDNREFINALRKFSKHVDTASLEALKAVVHRVVLATNEEELPHVEKYLPFRPLVFGGDDVTFLCNGQIGVSLAAAYLEAFEHKTTKYELGEMHACAGVSIVKMHYPFARAYKLSDELAESAKKLSRSGKDCSALDWHYATSGLSGDLKGIRRREFAIVHDKDDPSKDDLLTMRPVRLRDVVSDPLGRYWREGLEQVVMAFKEEKYWVDRKNKVVGLREPLRNGPDAVLTYRQNFELNELPPLGSPEAAQSGWQKENVQKRCVYFDAVEIFSQYIPLPTQEVKV